jgi:hypothetical protein
MGQVRISGSWSSCANMSDAYCRGISQPYPDFNTPHQCVNFEKVLEWGYQNAIHVPRDHVSRFGNVIDLPKAP